MEEVWKDIEGYEGIYQISNLGRVKSLKRITSQNKKLEERILANHVKPDGYVSVHLHNCGEKCVYVHRLVAQAFILNPNNRPEVNHIDGNKQNNCVNNLEWVTCSENIYHALDTGLNPNKGANCPWSKLSKEQADYIRTNFISGDKEFGGRALAKKFNVSPALISSIVNKKCRKSEYER